MSLLKVVREWETEHFLRLKNVEVEGEIFGRA